MSRESRLFSLKITGKQTIILPKFTVNCVIYECTSKWFPCSNGWKLSRKKGIRYISTWWKKNVRTTQAVVEGWCPEPQRKLSRYGAKTINSSSKYLWKINQNHRKCPQGPENSEIPIKFLGALFTNNINNKLQTIENFIIKLNMEIPTV